MYPSTAIRAFESCGTLWPTSTVNVTVVLSPGASDGAASLKL